MSAHSVKPAAPEVAVYLCECGSMLTSALDVPRLAGEAEGDPRVLRVAVHPTLCSADGQAWLVEDLRQNGARAMLIGGCSPREHLRTFRQVCSSAGLSPDRLALINLREQCAWVTPSFEEATEKAARLVRAGLRRVVLQEPTPEQQVPCNTDVLVLGSGVAGLTAARLLAGAERRVILVEREPCIGGRVPRLSEVSPDLECASCMTAGVLDELLHHPLVEVFTGAELTKLAGSFGQFRASIRLRPRRVALDACFGCPECLAACPVSVPNRFEEGLADRPAIYLPYPGALPNVPAIDEEACLHVRGQLCRACADACPFGAIDLEARATVITREIGAVVVATGNDQLEGLPSAGPRIITTMGLERLLGSSGPTRGEVRVRQAAPPSSVAVLHCASPDGSRASGCSAVCCSVVERQLRELREKLPEAHLYELFWERCSPWRGAQRALGADSQSPVERIRLRPDDRVLIGEFTSPTAGPQVELRWADQLLRVDLLVEAAPLVPARGTPALARVLGTRLSKQGFLMEAHPRLTPYRSLVRGIYGAGGILGPKDIRASVCEGAAAAASALSDLVPGRSLALDPGRVSAEADRCSGCKTCLSACPFGAPRFDTETGVTTIDERLCQGCGSCAARCPSGAIRAPGFTDEELLAELQALLANATEPRR